MRITFLLPFYPWTPVGGFRVVYEYANQLASRGHQVTVVHPRKLQYPAPSPPLNAWGKIMRQKKLLRQLLSKPPIKWQKISPEVRMLFVASSEARYIPDGDAIFATAWQTARSVLEYPETKGKKFYLIQHYETWCGPKDLVDASWRYPLHKIVIAKWLYELGEQLGCTDMTYIPNSIDHQRFRLTRPIEGRAPRIAMLASHIEFKGTPDGLEALRIARQKHPDLKAVLFGADQRMAAVPDWIEYHMQPAQDFLVNDIYNGSSIFLTPSWTEGSPLPPAEAACCGCAIVAADNGGVREYAHHGTTGLLSPVKDPQALAENLCLLLQNDDLRIRLAKAVNKLVNESSWERSAGLLESCLTSFVQAAPLVGNPTGRD